MTTFITGGTSSIGRVLVKELVRQGEALRILVRPNSDRRGLELPGVEFIRGDITDVVAVRKGITGCDRVCHLAAIVGSQAPEAEWWRVNRDGSRNVLQAAYDLHVASIVQVSSLSVLGPTKSGEVADESRSVNTAAYFSLYQKTKRAADDLAREYAAKGLPVKIVYPGFGYGCSHASSHASLAEQTLLRMAAGKPVTILGSGKNRICVAYYKDTVQGILLAHEHGQPGEGYILGGENLTFREIWAVVAEVLGKEPPRRRMPAWLMKSLSNSSRLIIGKPIFPADFLDMIRLNWNFSTEKAEQELGWQPHSFHTGMAETWAEYQALGWGSNSKRTPERAVRRA